jgi:hypothetical protein
MLKVSEMEIMGEKFNENQKKALLLSSFGRGGRNA